MCGFVRTQKAGTYVAWGKEKAKENSFVVEAGECLEGTLKEINTSDTYGKAYVLEKCRVADTSGKTLRQSEVDLVVVGTTVLNRELGYPKNKETSESEEQENAYQVGDKVAILFKGKGKASKKGSAPYLFEIGQFEETKKKGK